MLKGDKRMKVKMIPMINMTEVAKQVAHELHLNRIAVGQFYKDTFFEEGAFDKEYIRAIYMPDLDDIDVEIELEYFYRDIMRDAHIQAGDEFVISLD